MQYKTVIGIHQAHHQSLDTTNFYGVRVSVVCSRVVEGERECDILIDSVLIILTPN